MSYDKVGIGRGKKDFSRKCQAKAGAPFRFSGSPLNLHPNLDLNPILRLKRKIKSSEIIPKKPEMRRQARFGLN